MNKIYRPYGGIGGYILCTPLDNIDDPTWYDKICKYKIFIIAKNNYSIIWHNYKIHKGMGIPINKFYYDIQNN